MIIQVDDYFSEKTRNILHNTVTQILDKNESRLYYNIGLHHTEKIDKIRIVVWDKDYHDYSVDEIKSDAKTTRIMHIFVPKKVYDFHYEVVSQINLAWLALIDFQFYQETGKRIHPNYLIECHKYPIDDITNQLVSMTNDKGFRDALDRYRGLPR